jgi:hypothetical protein
LVRYLTALPLQRFSLLIDASAFSLKVLLKLDVVAARLGVGFDQLFGRVDDLLVVGCDEAILFRLAVDALTRKVNQALVVGATADEDQKGDRGAPSQMTAHGFSHAGFSRE